MRAVHSRYFQKGNIKLQLLHYIPFTRLLLGSSGNPLENPTLDTFIDNHLPAFERQTAPTCHQCPPRQCPDRVPREHTLSTVEGEGRGRRLGSSQSDGGGLRSDASELSGSVSLQCRRGPRAGCECALGGQRPPGRPGAKREGCMPRQLALHSVRPVSDSPVLECSRSKVSLLSH